MDANSNVWWLGPLGLTVLRILYVEARVSQARTRGNLLLFPAGLGIRFLFGGGIIGFSALVVSSIGQEATWLLVTMTMVILALCFAWPATITIGEDGIRQHTWWRPMRMIHWTDVTGIQKEVSGDIEVFCKQGKSLTFSRFYVDPLRFQDEVKRRAVLKGVIDASNPPSLKI